MGRIRSFHRQLALLANYWQVCRKFANVIAKNMQTGFLDKLLIQVLPLHQSTFLLTFNPPLSIMKTRVINPLSIIFTIMMLISLNASAQNYKAADSDLHGIWIMESMQFDGEKKVMCGRATGYTQFKYYGADGEYACAEIVRQKDGTIKVLPHEYGTYTFKDGWYSEMGREKIKDAITWVDKQTTKGRWKNRSDIWKKVDMPKPAVKYILDCCKTRSVPADISRQISEIMFK